MKRSAVVGILAAGIYQVSAEEFGQRPPKMVREDTQFLTSVPIEFTWQSKTKHTLHAQTQKNDDYDENITPAQSPNTEGFYNLDQGVLEAFTRLFHQDCGSSTALKFLAFKADLLGCAMVESVDKIYADSFVENNSSKCVDCAQKRKALSGNSLMMRTITALINLINAKELERLIVKDAPEGTLEALQNLWNAISKKEQNRLAKELEFLHKVDRLVDKDGELSTQSNHTVLNNQDYRKMFRTQFGFKLCTLDVVCSFLNLKLQHIKCIRETVARQSCNQNVALFNDKLNFAGILAAASKQVKQDKNLSNDNKINLKRGIAYELLVLRHIEESRDCKDFSENGTSCTHNASKNKGLDLVTFNETVVEETMKDLAISIDEATNRHNRLLAHARTLVLFCSVPVEELLRQIFPAAPYMQFMSGPVGYFNLYGRYGASLESAKHSEIPNKSIRRMLKDLDKTVDAALTSLPVNEDSSVAGKSTAAHTFRKLQRMNQQYASTIPNEITALQDTPYAGNFLGAMQIPLFQELQLMRAAQNMMQNITGQLTPFDALRQASPSHPGGLIGNLLNMMNSRGNRFNRFSFTDSKTLSDNLAMLPRIPRLLDNSLSYPATQDNDDMYRAQLMEEFASTLSETPVASETEAPVIKCTPTVQESVAPIGVIKFELKNKSSSPALMKNELFEIQLPPSARGIHRQHGDMNETTNSVEGNRQNLEWFWAIRELSEFNQVTSENAFALCARPGLFTIRFLISAFNVSRSLGSSEICTANIVCKDARLPNPDSVLFTFNNAVNSDPNLVVLKQ